MTRAEILAFMESPEFEERAKALEARVDSGFVPTDEDLSEALGLPLEFVLAQVAEHGALVASFMHGGRLDA